MSSQQQQGPGQKTQQGDQNGGNTPDQGKSGTSRPKDPNNDPDQTPNREVKNPPKADPNQKPGKQPYK